MSTADAAVMLQLEQLMAEADWKALPSTDFLGAKFDYGLAWVHFPVGLGGLGAAPSLQAKVDQVLADAGLPDRQPTSSIGYGICAPGLLTWGTQEQKARHLRPLYTGEEIWCQLFSEPGAGSDIAGLATMVRKQDDHWVASGQKVWTSYGHLARWGLLIARTDPDVEKYAGLSAFIVDMHQPGVEVRPLRQITGEAQFNEVFLDDARIEPDQMVGDLGQGWSVALTTLMNERVAIGGKHPSRGSGAIAPLVNRWNAIPEPERDPVEADRLTDLWIRSELLRLTNIRHSHSRSAGGPGPIGSIGKIATAELNQQISEMWLELEGLDGLEFDYDAITSGQSSLRQTAQYTFLRSRANSIEGGTSEVMRNIIGERVLGLPAEPRADRGMPWREVPRG